MIIEYGRTERVSEELRYLKNFQPDQRKLVLYNKVKRYCDLTARLTAIECIEYCEDLNNWAAVKGYSHEELKEMRASIRL